MDKTALTIQTYDKSAHAFAQKFMNLDLYKEKLSSFCKLLQPGAKILDLGCGPGNVAKFLLAANQGFTVLGIDLSEEMVKLARQNVPADAVTFKVADIRQLEVAEAEYDAVIASFCIVHLNDEEAKRLLRDISGMLRNNGLLYLSCMEGNKSGFESTSFSDGSQIFFNYYSEEFLRALLIENQLEVLEIARQDYPEVDGSITTDMIWFARKVG